MNAVAVMIISYANFNPKKMLFWRLKIVRNIYVRI